MISDLQGIKTIYFIGIKGVAMSGLAVICRERGMIVYGSDVPEKFITDRVLDRDGITVFDEFSADNLSCHPDLVVIGASWDQTNSEVQSVLAQNIPHLTDSEMRGLLSREKKTIAVTGVHGKTTTTALLAHVFNRAGLDPSYLVGTGVVPDLGGNAHWSNGEYFIVEGDEYVRSKQEQTAKFLDLVAATAIITSIEWEHVDVYPTAASIEAAFAELVKKTKNIVACADWPSVKKIITGRKNVVTYGTDLANQWVAFDIRQEFDGMHFKIKKGKDDLGDFFLTLFGEHNVLNATAVVIVALQAGIALDIIKNGLASFSGAQRRFDVSEQNGFIFVDDYAHHPTAIKTTLRAIRHRYPDKTIWCVFQPHMASRTKALLTQFSTCFGDANKVIFADIFASAREAETDITSRQLADETKKQHPDVVYAGDLNQAADYVKKNITSNSVLVTMGAGDVYRVRDKFIKNN